MEAPTPIPTLPITSATAAQSAHIASLTTQLHQLVEKNNAISAQLEMTTREGRERVHEEVRRSEEVVRLMRRAHLDEMEGIKERMETLRISAVHAQHSIAYAHQVTKTDLLLTEQALVHQKRQNVLLSAGLVRAAGAERLLQSRLTTAKTSHAIQQEALLAQLERSRADLLAAQTRGAVQDDKTVSKLKNQLDTLRASLSTSQETIKLLEGETAKVHLELGESHAALEVVRGELKEERSVRKEREREVREVRELLSAKDTADTNGAEMVKVHKRRVKELEVALAAEKGRVEELEGEKAVLEKERRRMEKRLEKEKDLAAPPSPPTLKASSTGKKKDADSVKSKKRPREEEEEEEGEEGGGLVIQGAFGVPKSGPGKKHKKPKVDDSDTERSKPSKLKPSKPIASSISTKPKKPPTTKATPVPPPSSPPAPSPSPISTAQFSENEEEDAPVIVKKPAKSAAAAVEQPKRKFKAPPPPPPRDEDEDDEEEGEGGAADDSDDFAAKKARFFGGSVLQGKGKKANVPSKKSAVKEKAEKERGEAKPAAASARHHEEEELFDLDAVSDTSDGEDLEELVKKPKVRSKLKEAVVETKTLSKPRAMSKAPVESEGKSVKKATTATTTSTTTGINAAGIAAAASKSKVKDRGGKVEVENAPAPASPIAKPKKRTFNLLGSTTNNALTGAGLNAFGSWGGGLNENVYNIPSQLSSPEKGSVPRAKFGN